MSPAYGNSSDGLVKIKKSWRAGSENLDGGLSDGLA
jgi:hypothetical protein